MARLPHPEPSWPVADGRPIVFLIDASSSLERRLLTDWIERNKPDGLPPGGAERVSIAPSRRKRPGSSQTDARLATLLLEEDNYDPLLVPMRVAWLAPMRNGVRAVRPLDLLKLGDPRDPDWIRQRWILRSHPDRAEVVVGEAAPASELKQRWRDRTLPGDPEDAGFPSFVAVQAALALERQERRLRGNRYKVPKFVQQDLFDSRSTKAGLVRLAEETDWPAHRIPRRAVRYLKEIAATHSPYVIDIVAHFTRWLLQRSYDGRVHYDADALADIYQLGERHSLVFLPTHKAYIDTLILDHVLYENDYPPNHTAGGINMSFFPVGPIVRRAGVFFIRRSFRDNPVYRFMLGQYIRYLVSKSFPLEWYLEGGRSRSGKLREPRYGLLGYVVAAYDAEAAEDVVLVPVSIAYDQLYDVTDHASEQRGLKKKGESAALLFKFLRATSKSHGSVHLRFGTPLSMAAEIGPPNAHRQRDERQNAIQKLAFEVSVRINQTTPMTPISLVSLALLGSGDRALSVSDTQQLLRPYLDFVRDRHLPTTEELELDSPNQVAEALEHLVEHNVVSRYDHGLDLLYGVGPNQHHVAAYYRNTIIHFFIETAIGEIALVAASQSGQAGQMLWAEAEALRDLLKFEFFFRKRDEFREAIATELDRYGEDWAARIEAGDALQLLSSADLLTAHWVLQPWLEAYLVVADELVAYQDQYEEEAFLESALQRGEQYVLRRKIKPASVSTAIFKTALQLAGHRGLLVAGQIEKRKALAAEIASVLAHIETIAAVDAATVV